MKRDDDSQRYVQVDAELCFFEGLLLGTLIGPRYGGGGGGGGGGGRGPVYGRPGMVVRPGLGPVGPMGPVRRRVGYPPGVGPMYMGMVGPGVRRGIGPY